MKLAARLRGFSDEALVEGGADAEREARDALRRDQRLRVAMTSNRPELPRSDLAPAHLGLLEHTPTGEFYAISQAEQHGEKFDAFAAFFVDQAGDAVFLQRPPSGPQSRAELEAHRSSRAAS